MNARQGSNTDRSSPQWVPPVARRSGNNGIDQRTADAELIPDLNALERSVGHLGSDWLGLAHVMIVCTRALIAQMRRIERRLPDEPSWPR